jgi:hypothetical protein
MNPYHATPSLLSIYTRGAEANACVACDLDFDSCSERRGEERRGGEGCHHVVDFTGRRGLAALEEEASCGRRWVDKTR